MADVLNRRTFVRGAAGAVGVGAVSALSPNMKLGATELGPQPMPVEIEVELRTRGRKKHISCPDASAAKNDNVKWKIGSGVETIRLVAFKGPSPLSEELLENTSTGDLDGGSVRGNAPLGRYSYTIVVKEDGGPKSYALDPDLDII